MQIENNKQTELSIMSIEQLKRELEKGLIITAKSLYYLAYIWKELEYRGENLDSLRAGLFEYLPLIAENRISPETVIKYAGQKILLNAISKLSPNLQEKILSNDSVDILVMNENYETSIKKIPLSNLSSLQVYQVFSEENLRTENEQKLLLRRSRVNKTRSNSSHKYTAVVEIDSNKHNIIIGTYCSSISIAIEALSEHFKIDLKKILYKD